MSGLTIIDVYKTYRNGRGSEGHQHRGGRGPVPDPGRRLRLRQVHAAQHSRARNGDAGDIYIGGRRVNDLLPRDRDMAMVFQSYALYPRMTVFENLGSH